ncbi:hypothetical protein [Leisingera thetidis]|uniref:hypothetical protein n=1 Tax=Leisingera thetidis TaxID=2930199 RepID=UPI0021F76D20|nr:hypothetical protein [Leisingera thetidis]
MPCKPHMFIPRDRKQSHGTGCQLPTPCSTGLTRMLYVFDGSIEFDGHCLISGGAAILSGEDAGLILFSTDEAAPVFKGGMFRGNKLAA